jgi:hypothetical protein
MQRYFFDLIDSDRIISDAEGQEFAHAEEAKAHALNVAAQLRRRLPKERADGRWISVRNKTGVALFKVPLSSPLV